MPGQNRAWRSHHKKICKQYNAYIASTQYSALTTHDQVDALLLTQLVAEPGVWRANYKNADDPFSLFLGLLTGPGGYGPVPPLVPPLALSTADQTEEVRGWAQGLYTRFGNNNFVLHSHLNSYAHGIFPLASRLFNHSCVPNAACKYIITPSEPVKMQVVALNDIAEGEEVSSVLSE